MVERFDEIEAHHKQHDLSENQNTKGRNAPKIDEVKGSMQIENATLSPHYS